MYIREGAMVRMEENLRKKREAGEQARLVLEERQMKRRRQQVLQVQVQ